MWYIRVSQSPTGFWSEDHHTCTHNLCWRRCQAILSNNSHLEGTWLHRPHGLFSHFSCDGGHELQMLVLCGGDHHTSRFVNHGLSRPTLALTDPSPFLRHPAEKLKLPSKVLVRALRFQCSSELCKSYRPGINSVLFFSMPSKSKHTKGYHTNSHFTRPCLCAFLGAFVLWCLRFAVDPLDGPCGSAQRRHCSHGFGHLGTLPCAPAARGGDTGGQRW